MITISGTKPLFFDPSYPLNDTNRHKKHLDINRIFQSICKYLTPVSDPNSPNSFGNIVYNFPLVISNKILTFNERHLSQFAKMEGVTPNDCMLHHLARWMVSYRRKFYVLRFQEYLDLIIRHFNEGGGDLLLKKNILDEYFYEIPGLTSLEKCRLCLLVSLACQSRYDEVMLYKHHLMECFTSTSLVSCEEESATFKEFKGRLVDFIAISQVDDGNFLHWMVREVWRNDSKNELIDNNLKELIKFLEPKPSFNSFQNTTFSQFLEECNCDGLSFKGLYRKLEAQHSPHEESKSKVKYINELFVEFSETSSIRQTPLANIHRQDFATSEPSLSKIDVSRPKNKRFLEKYFCPVSEYEKILKSIFSAPLNSKISINLNGLFQCLAGKINYKEVNDHNDNGDKLLHFIIRLKHQSGPILQTILDKNIKFIEFVCNKYLSDKEKEYFLEAKNNQGLSYRELDNLLRKVTYAAPHVTVDPKWKIPNYIDLKFKDPKLMYNLCLSPTLFDISSDIIVSRASKFGKKANDSDFQYYDNENADDRLLVSRGDTYLHILVRHLLNNKNPYARNHLLNFFLLAAQNHSHGLAFLNAKNANNHCFWEISGLSDFSRRFFLFWIGEILKAFSNPATLEVSITYSKRFLEQFSTVPFDSFSGELKENLTNFLLHAKSLSSLYSGNTILHVLVKKIWESGKQNELIKNNFLALFEFLLNHDCSHSENALIIDLIHEKNRNGLTCMGLFDKLKLESAADHKVSLSEQEHFLITYYTEKARDFWATSSNSLSPQEQESFRQNLMNTAREHHRLMHKQDHSQENQNFAERIHKFHKKLTKQLAQFI